MRPEDINGQVVDISSVELDTEKQSLFYGKHYYGSLTIMGSFELDGNIYIVTKEHNEWTIKQIIIDTLINRTNKQIIIIENIIINLNNIHYSTKTIDNIKYYLSKYGTLDQTNLKDVDININNANTNFYATTDNNLFNKLTKLKNKNKDIPLNTLVKNDLQSKNNYQI